MKLSIIFLLAINVAFAQPRQDLKWEISTLLARQKLSGAVWSTVGPDGKVLADSYGYKNVKTKQSLSPTDKVQVGSVSKTVLAAGFLRMATLGLLNLDDPVQKYLPNLPIENPFSKANPVTIRHLLDHTSGLTDAKLWHIFSTTATPNTPLKAVYRNEPNLLKIQCKPGSVYSYSNLGYTLLGMLIEKVSKIRYEDYLDYNLLKPLGMENSSFQFISQASDKALAFGHFDKGEPVMVQPMYLRPAGQFTTTAEDLGKFLRFMMSDGKLNGKPFISTEYLSAVGKQKRTDAFNNGLPFGDGLGAYARDRYGVVGLAKNGNTLGFAAMIYLFPEYQKAFFIAFNMDSETANYDPFNEVLVKHLNLPTRPFTAKGQKLDATVEKWKGYYAPILTKVEPFGLLDLVFSHTKVETSKTGAVLLPFQGKSKSLIYKGKNLFAMKDRTQVSHVFYTAHNGHLLITDGVKTLKKVHGLKIVGIAASLLLGVVSLIYVGIAGCANLIKYKLAFRHKPLFWVFIAVLTLFISFAFIATQPFMRMGDLTTGNVLLYSATWLLPIFSMITFILILTHDKSNIRTVRFWAILFILQFCAVLMLNNLMPLKMW